MEGGLLLDVVVGQGAAILELLAREDQALLVGGDALLVLRLNRAAGGLAVGRYRGIISRRQTLEGAPSGGGPTWILALTL